MGGLGVAEKIIKSHLVSGKMVAGEEIALRIDQTLTQDATGTMAYLEFEAMGVPSVKTELSVAYIDHNMLQSSFMNEDDHRFIQSAAKKYGLYFSRPGNGICHQVHLERFGKPGKTLIGSDSHTPTGGGIGMLAMGAGGLDVAVAMGGGAYYITMPKIYKINLKGKLRDFVTAKDVSLELLRILSVKGGVGAIMEWAGEGVATLSVPERATITNMGTELGATTSIFPSDEITRDFLAKQGREEDYVEIKADEDARYDRVIDIDLSTLEPLIACPHSPDNIEKVKDVAGRKVDQVCIGSCTNSSLLDLKKVARLLENKTVNENVSLSISPGSKQVLTMLANSGDLGKIIGSGARILECGCGPCIGMGFSPKSAGVSLRTFNRNFQGRSGTADGQVYLVSPETAVAAAITGKITDPRELKDFPKVSLEEDFQVNDNLIIPPFSIEEREKTELVKGPNIKEIPIGKALENQLTSKVSLKVGDNITTDHIMPAGSKILPYRSNVPHLSQYCFEVCDSAFPERAKELGESIIIGGHNYGQGSSREHAALVPLYLGVRCVIAKSFARIHVANLINSGILPLSFEKEEDYDFIMEGDSLRLKDIHQGLDSGTFVVVNEENNREIKLLGSFTQRQKEMLLCGGLLNYIGKENK